MRAAIITATGSGMPRVACIIYDGDLEVALNRQGRFYRRDIRVLEDREITDYVINDQRTILKRG